MDSAPISDSDPESPPSPSSSSKWPPSPSSSSKSPPSPSSSSKSPPSPSSSSKSSPPPPPPSSPPPSPPPPSDDKKSAPPPTLSPPPPTPSPRDQNSNSSLSPPPTPPSGNRSPNPSLPQPPVSSFRTSDQGLLSRHKHHRVSPPPVQDSTPASSDLNSGSPSSGNDGARLNPAVMGMAAGVGILLVAITLLVIAYLRKKKKSGLPQYDYNNNGTNGLHAADAYYKCASISNHQQHWSGAYKYNSGEQIHITTPSPPMPSSTDLSNFSSGTQSTPRQPPQPLVALGFHKSNFTFDELSAATGGFAQANLIGQGGFGYVHKGVLANGKEIAVKSLKSIGGQGEKEFKAEIEVISRVHHRHLVSLVGYCISEGKNLLVYEFVPNKTLEFHLHGNGRPVMEWSTRLKIAIGSAKGLAYLHEDCNPRIIHRDIKAANILIQDNFEAKVADFGLARLNQDNNTHISTRVMGTFGYMAPDYASSGKLTEKSDVFSYGVMLLELITGRRPIDLTGDCEDESLVEWARPLCTKALESGNYEGLVDPRLENNYEKQEMARMVACAAASVRRSARKRPKMSQIVRALDGAVSLDVLSEGVKPGHSSMFSNTSSEYDAISYRADMDRFRKLALDSGYASNNFGGTGVDEVRASTSTNDSSEHGGKTKS